MNASQPALTSLRAVAAALVVAAHYTTILYPGSLGWIAETGYIGVDIFFVLSAFLLTITYQHAPFAPGMFFIRRAARILPLYFVVLGLNALTGVQTTLMNWTLMQGWSSANNATGLLPAWTLTVEITFYALLPLLLAIPTPRLSHKLLFVATLTTSGLLLGTALYPPEERIFMLLRTIFAYAFDFALGIVAGRLYLRHGAPRRGLLFLAAGIIGLLTTQYALVLFGGSQTGRALLFPAALFAALLIYGLTAPSIVARLLSWPPLVFLGRISYAVYLLHLTPFCKLFATQGLLAFYIGTSVIAAALYISVEVPAHRWIVRQFTTNNKARYGWRGIFSRTVENKLAR